MLLGEDANPIFTSNDADTENTHDDDDDEEEMEICYDFH